MLISQKIRNKIDPANLKILILSVVKANFVNIADIPQK